MGRRERRYGTQTEAQVGEAVLDPMKRSSVVGVVPGMSAQSWFSWRRLPTT